MAESKVIDNDVREFCRERANAGKSYVRAGQIAEVVDASSQSIGHVLRRMREDGDLEVWSDGGMANTYEITMGETR